MQQQLHQLRLSMMAIYTDTMGELSGTACQWLAGKSTGRTRITQGRAMLVDKQSKVPKSSAHTKGDKITYLGRVLSPSGS